MLDEELNCIWIQREIAIMIGDRSLVLSCQVDVAAQPLW